VEKRQLVADFESRLDDRYVAQDAQRSQTLAIQIGAGSPPSGVPPPATVDTVWPFRDEQRGYSVVLGNSSLAVEADSSYHDFPQFLEEFSAAVRACAEIFHPKRQMRLGLRYVNEISDERLGEDLRAIIRPELVAPVGSAVQGGLLRSLTELRISESLGIFVVRHGLVEDTTYLLDLDYFSETQRDFDTQSVIETVKQFHELIEPFFVWSLSRRYLAELKRKDGNAS
jgi:uncharacterized protein (TIGR04255 family)